MNFLSPLVDITMNNIHHPRKRFGQHFLKDHNVLQKIVRVIDLQQTDHVVEIGPGQGALTHYLLEKITHLDAVELDRDLVSFLQQNYDPSRLTVHSADALNFSYSELSHTQKELRVVGNLPYNISTPLLFHLFSHIDCIRDMHFMLQKEVVLRLTAKVGTADYSRLSIMSQYFCDNQYLFTVSPHSFDPPPRVESAIVRLTPRKERNVLTAEQYAVFSNVVKEAFNYRRKKLSNGLKKFIDSKALAAINIDPNVRPEELSVAEFIRIALAISVH